MNFDTQEAVLANNLVQLNGVATITDKDDEASLKRKDEDYRSARKKLQGTIQWSLILGLPLVFAGIGILRWRMREGQRSLKRL